MLFLICFVFALAVLALPPSEHKIGLLSLLDGDVDTTLRTPNSTHAAPTLSPSARPSTNPFGTPSHSSTKQSTSTSTTPTDSAGPTTVQAALSTPSTTPASAENYLVDHSSKTWQIVGIAIICVLFVAVSITCAMFFDRLWEFLRDIVCCTSHPPLAEEFISDCEQQAWNTVPKAKPLCPEPSLGTKRARELPWNADRSPFYEQPC